MTNKAFNYLLALFLLLLIMSCGSARQDRAENLAPSYELTFAGLAPSWDEGIPLGNATVGALVWQKEGKLRFSLDRADLWDLRPMANLDFEQYGFDWVYQQWKNKTYKLVQDKYDLPYNQSPAPSKIPGAAMEFDISSLGPVEYVKLILKDAVCEVKWKNAALLRTFVHANDPVGWYRFENLPEDLLPELIPPVYTSDKDTSGKGTLGRQDLRRLGYEQGKITRGQNSITYDQKGWSDFSYQVHTRWEQQDNTLTGSWSISSSLSEKESQQNAQDLVSVAFSDGMPQLWESHQQWWNKFWNQSMVSVPDSILQQQWYMDVYKFGSAARADAPPISLQSVWTADNGQIPPWKGDFHHDLNTQLSYWPAYSGNHLGLEEGFINWMEKYKDTFKQYTKGFYGTNGLNVPGVTTLTGEPMGGWIQYAFSPTVSAWLGQHYYLHWRYSMDRDFLENKAYPWIRDVAVHFDELSVVAENGKRKLPLTSSPEIRNNSRDAWFGEMTNYDLALVRWIYQTAAELAGELGKQEEAEKWKKTLHEWPGYAVDESGLMFSPDLPYKISHRHFSHLMAIHPLSLLDVSNGEEEKQLIERTIANLDKVGTSAWTGYSFSWLGNLKARALDGEGAAKALKDFATAFVLPNSFHVNGDQSGTGKSNFTYRPFTLEGNFAFASGLQEMLIQSHTGTVKLFPAIPDDWQTVSFKKLRTEGAFLVSAGMQEGEVKEVRILPEKGGELKLQYPAPVDAQSLSIRGASYEWDGDTLLLECKRGEEIILKRD